MPEQNDQRRNGDGKSWAQWKQELSEAIEELDKACAKARQYQLRPLVRPRVRGASKAPLTSPFFTLEKPNVGLRD